MVQSGPGSYAHRTPIPARVSPLRRLQLIESVGDVTPFRIVPISQTWGTVVSDEDRMAAKVKWAEQARYTVLTTDIPQEYTPYNCVIRISEQGTEDSQRDYLAELVQDEVDA